MSNQPEAKIGGLPAIDVNEYGGKKDGERQVMNRRLFMQLVVFDMADGDAVEDAGVRLSTLLKQRNIAGVVYADTANPHGLGLLTWSEDPAHFVDAVRPLFRGDGVPKARMRPGFAMMGRTYSFGHEPDLEHAILKRPIEYVTNPAWPWHMWYPLRRIGASNRLDAQEQAPIMREHANIGFAYGQADLGHDVRLACHGLDADDNEFVIGLVGKDLHPLSHLVQAMRKTVQTSQYIAKMGPFFVGRVISQR